MIDNRIDATLPQADLDAIMAAIQNIRQKLPFLIDLSPQERRAILKLGDKSRAFTRKALEVATQNPAILPRAFEVGEMQRDVALFEALEQISMALDQLHELVDDTMLAVGSEAYAAALMVYQYARTSGRGGALDAVADDLGRRFARKAPSKTGG